MFQWVQVPSVEALSCHRSQTRRREGGPTRRLELALPNEQVAGFSDREGAAVRVHLNNGGLVEHDFEIIPER